LIFSSFSARVAMMIVDDRGEGQKACGDAVLAVMEKTRREKKRYSGFLARLSIRNYELSTEDPILLWRKCSKENS
jgi:hypothetical protein